LDKNTVERNRKIYRYNRNRAQRKIDKAIIEQRSNARKIERHQISKQRQNKYKAQRLIEITKQRKS
jgi:hypothetical protein